MALDDIFRALEEQADKDIDDILEAARVQAGAIAEEANAQIAETRRRRLEQAERVARNASAQRLNAARLEEKKKLAAIKERALQEAFDRASGALGGIRKNSDYVGLFRMLAEEAVASVDGEPEVHVDRSDADLAASTLGTIGVKARIVPDLTTAGGLDVVTGGGRVRRRDTLEDRLSKLRRVAQSDVAGILFS